MYHVLIVDDNQPVLTLMEQYLKSEGIKITSFSNSVLALDYIFENPTDIDLLILDLAMPEISGVEILDSIRSKKITKDLPSIISTVFNKEKILSLFVRYGILDYVSKPIDKSIFIEKVNSILKRVEMKKDSDYSTTQGKFRKGELSNLINRSIYRKIDGTLEVFSEDERFVGKLELEKGVLKEIRFIVDNEIMPFSKERAVEAIDDISKGFYQLNNLSIYD